MTSAASILLTFAALAGPAILFAILSVFSLIGRPLSERATGSLVSCAMFSSFAACLGLCGILWIDPSIRLTLSMGKMAIMPGYAFEFTLLVDRLSLPYLTLTVMLCGVTGRFAHQYLHREPGYGRFFVQYSMFVAGMQWAALAGSMETMIAAWELVGLSSVLLIGFFHDRPEPVRNSWRVWAVYRVGDLGLIFAAVLAHHWAGAASFDALFGPNSLLLRHESLWVFGLLILLAAMGKSALVPFSGWLPRAMEGPTPSSAIFYGSLSVHLGAFLLLRAGPVLEASPVISALIAAVGIATALHGTINERVQTDIKSALSYASLTQVGVIVAEIGFGLRLIPLIHIIGHACVRTLQFLRSPSLLHDLHHIEDEIGAHAPRAGTLWEKILPENLRARLYRMALERGYLEAILRDGVARPFLETARMFDRLERKWVGRMGGRK